MREDWPVRSGRIHWPPAVRDQVRPDRARSHGRALNELRIVGSSQSSVVVRVTRAVAWARGWAWGLTIRGVKDTDRGRPRVDHDGSAATAMLGLPGFVLLAVSANDGEVEQAVETLAAEDFCRGCGVVARLHDRRPSWVRDLPSAGRPVTLVWVKRVWRCVEPACAVRTWTRTAEQIRPRAGWTVRAAAEACRRVGEDGHSVAQVARAFGVSWARVMTAVCEPGTPLVDDPARREGPPRLGFWPVRAVAGRGRGPRARA